MTRILSKYASKGVKKELDRLLRAKGNPQAYRQAMFDLGVSLGNISSVDVLIIVKSIISTSCVVRTNLEEVMQRTLPKSIFVVAPVMYKDAPSSLKKEFPKSISQKFQYLYFAKDSERTDSGEVRPGIGGSVYELLGFRTRRQKDRYRPEILKEWLKKHTRVETPR